VSGIVPLHPVGFQDCLGVPLHRCREYRQLTFATLLPRLVILPNCFTAYRSARTFCVH
jgi:hypothetical protein